MLNPWDFGFQIGDVADKDNCGVIIQRPPALRNNKTSQFNDVSGFDLQLCKI